MAVVTLKTTTSTSPSSGRPNLVSPSPARIDPVREVQAATADSFGQFLGKMAEREERELERLTRNEIAAKVSAFETDSLAKLVELDATGVEEGKTFVETAVEDFSTRAKELESGYSPFFQEEIKKQLLPVQERVASSALSMQVRRVEDEYKRNAEEFSNNLVNKVRFGMVSEGSALSSVAEFSNSLPDNLREGLRQKMTEATRVASMDRLLMESPGSFLRSAKKGDFNDVDPSIVSRAVSSATRTLAEQREAAVRRQEKLEKMAASDPMRAAREALASQGITVPSRQQLLQTQQQLGVHPVDVALLTKDEAKLYQKELSSLSNIDEAIGWVAQTKATFVEKGEDWELVKADLDRFSEDVNPAVLSLVEYADNPMAYPVELGEALMELSRDPKAAEKAKTLLLNSGVPLTQVQGLQQEAFKEVQEDLAIRVRSGSSPEDSLRALSSVQDTAMVLAAKQWVSTGEVNPKTASRVAASLSEGRERRLNNRDAYSVPASLSRSLSEQYMEFIRDEVLSSEDLSIPSGYPTASFGREDIRKRAGWTQSGPSAVMLTVGGAPVLVGGSPVIKSWNEMLEGVVEASGFESGEPPLVGVGLGGTAVVQP